MPPRPAQRSFPEILAAAQALPALDRLLLQLKALIGALPLNKMMFQDVVRACAIPEFNSEKLSARGVDSALNRLQQAGLIDALGVCEESIQHKMAAAISDDPYGPVLIQAIKAVLIPQIYRFDPFLRMSLRYRLALYGDDETLYQELTDEVGPLILRRVLGASTVDLDWFARRPTPVQIDIFRLRLADLTNLGGEAADFPALFAYMDAHQAEDRYQDIRSDLAFLALLQGRLTDLQQALTNYLDAKDYYWSLLQASFAFLTGRNDAALTGFRLALKQFRQLAGRRKVFFDGVFGQLFLLALLKAGDPRLHAEIQTSLDLVARENNPYSMGFEAIRVMLWLAQGLEAKAREQARKIIKMRPDQPIAAAMVLLAVYWVDADLLKPLKGDMRRRYAEALDGLALAARILGEILVETGQADAEITGFVTANPEIIAFTRVLEVRQSWERTLDSLQAFLQSPSAGSASAPAKGKRLAWFVDPETREIEALEQTAKSRSGWTIGRAIAMKRLYEQDPRLDFLTDHDRRVLRTIEVDRGSWGMDDSHAFNPIRTLPQLIGHPTVFDARARERKLELVAYPVELIVAEQPKGYKFALSHHAPMPTVFLEAETADRYRVIEFTAALQQIAELLGPKGLVVPRQARDRVIALVREQDQALPIRAEIAAIDLPGRAGVSIPVLQLQRLDDGLKLQLWVRPFGEVGPAYHPGQGGRSVLAVLDGRQERANRDLDQERAAAKRFVASCPTLAAAGADVHDWLFDDLEQGLDVLLEVQASAEPVRLEWPEGQAIRLGPALTGAAMTVRVSGDRDWFHLAGTVAVDEDLVLDMQDLLERLGRARGRFIPLDDGRFLTLTRQFRSQLEQLGALSESDKAGRRLPALAGIAVQDLVESAGNAKIDRHWRGFVQKLRAAGSHEPVVPSTLQAELRDYQRDGFVWLSRLAHWGAGACLADDMGLGKTVQAIAVMLERASAGPCLVVAPTSVCPNWSLELARFAPTLTVHGLAAGAERASVVRALGPMSVLIISYGLLAQMGEILAEVTWSMVVFDEAQAIKNAETKRARASQLLQAGFRLALTGTPIENYLEELWSLFNTINPGLLGSKERFQQAYVTPIERDRNSPARHALRGLIRPFILRRTKAAVLAELPPRTEVTLSVELPEEERAFYEALRRRALEALSGLADTDPGQRRIHILAEITRLRRACAHPGLVDATTQLPGAKLESFVTLVQDLTRNHHKALVFSQFLGQLERVRQVLDRLGVPYQYLDGSTPAKDRADRVAAFQAGQGDVFLISLRAGGVGLNLTAADYVIHLDPWWNPAVEDQASDRAHRIGQQRPVTVYRLIIAESIEEKILKLHQDKRDLAADLLDGAEMSGRLSEQQLLELLIP